MTDAEIDASSGELSAWMDKFPAFGKRGARKLPNTWRSLRRWQRLSPSLAETLGASGVVGDGVPSGGARPAYYGIVGDDRAPLICTPREAPAHEAVRSRASASWGLCRTSRSHPRCRGDGQTHKGPDVQRYIGARWASRTQTRSLLDGPERPRLEKRTVALRLSDLPPFLPKGDNRFDAATKSAPPIETLGPVNRHKWTDPALCSKSRNEDGGRS